MKRRGIKAAMFLASALVLGAASPTTGRDRRISFAVDLGPAHAHQQYTPAASALEAAGRYWTTRVVELRPARGR